MAIIGKTPDGRWTVSVETADRLGGSRTDVYLSNGAGQKFRYQVGANEGAYAIAREFIKGTRRNPWDNTR